MAAASDKIIVRGRGWFNQLKQVDKEPMEKISSVVTTGDELELTILNDLTNRICYYDHGPAISLFEIETFTKHLCKNIKELGKDENEIFCYMLTAISRCKDDNYVLTNSCVLILKPPYLVLLKFGNAENVKYLIHLYNHVLYTLGDPLSRPVPYSEASMPAFRSMYENLKKDMISAEEKRVLRDFSGFRESMKKEVYQYSQDIATSTDNTKQYTEAISLLADKVIEAETQLQADTEVVKAKFVNISDSMLGGGKDKNQHKGKLNLPELHKKDPPQTQI